MSKVVWVLGINAYHGDASAALLRNGELIAAVEEERFRRVKHWAGFPSEAIRKVLDMAGIKGREISHVAVSRDPKANLMQKGFFALSKRPGLSLIVDRMRNAQNMRQIGQPLAQALDIPLDDVPRIHYVEHHKAHLASSFMVSPFERAALCAIDGFGDFVSTSIGRGSANRIEVEDRVYFPHSLGILYTAITQYLGFHSYGDEFKVMGLAPYGKPEFVSEIRQLVELKENGRFELDLDYFVHWSGGVEMEWNAGYPNMGIVYSPKLEQLLGKARDPKEPLTPRHEAMAHSLQVVYEECAFHVLNALAARTGESNLCLAGGCAMNSVANGKIRARTPFKNVYIQPAAADNGTSLGAAYYAWHHVLGNPRSFEMKHGYWGTEYPDFDVQKLLDTVKSDDWRFTSRTFASEQDLCREVAQLVADGNVVGWYRGRMEWGARALGNRSIVADPRRHDMRELINTKIKFREKFRPFAPSIKEEAIADYFEDAVPDPFMLQVYPIKPEKQSVIPAVTHVDGSGRLQTVNRAANPGYYALIDAFEKITGVPIVLNTSFNENEPIVDTPEQAFDCFYRTRMDVIVINNTVVQRFPAHKPAATNA